MKTHPGMRLAASSLAVLFLTLAGTAKADVCGSIAGNVVANCGFETGDFSGWTLSGNLQGGAPPNFYYGVDNTNPNSGSYAEERPSARSDRFSRSARRSICFRPSITRSASISHRILRPRPAISITSISVSAARCELTVSMFPRPAATFRRPL